MNLYRMARRRTATGTTESLNCLLHFDPRDQKALLDVIHDYFTNSQEEDEKISDIEDFSDGDRGIVIVLHKLKQNHSGVIITKAYKTI